MSAPLRILLLADDQKGANTIHHHIQSFKRYSKHDIQLFNPRNLSRSRFLNLGAFDVVVVHYSITVIWDDYLSQWFRDRIAAYDGLKVQFIQDEYRYVDEITAQIRGMGIDVLYSVIPPTDVPAIYGGRLPDTEILFTLTGYVPEDIDGVRITPLAERPIDVGYRGRSVPYWLGRLGHEKVEIGRRFLAEAPALGLRCDIAWSERSRIYGRAWYEWIASCRSMLGSESGASIVDFDGSAEAAVRRHIAERPFDSYPELERSALAPFLDGPSINAISPRVFESAAMRTALVMFPGDYSGVVEPWTHYIPLEKDFSNLPEVAAQIRDVDGLIDLTNRAYDDLIASQRFSYQRFVAQFDEEIEARTSPRIARHARPRPSLLRAEELRAGRTYGLSAFYGHARELALTYLAAKQLTHEPGLRRLARRAFARRNDSATRSASLWDDVLRLALLSGVRAGKFQLGEEPFHIDAALESGRLTLTSRRGRALVDADVRGAVIEATRSREIHEIVWNHAPVGQYLALPLPVVSRSIYLDVGRYDSYGVYRFDRLVEIARDDPDLVLAALEPLLAAADLPSSSNNSEAHP
jgi:hypothetical protein